MRFFQLFFGRTLLACHFGGKGKNFSFTNTYFLQETILHNQLYAILLMPNAIHTKCLLFAAEISMVSARIQHASSKGAARGETTFFQEKRKIFAKMFGGLKKVVFLQRQKRGALAQLARALAWHARGHRFDSVMLHK